MDAASAIAGLIGLAHVVSKILVPYVAGVKGARQEIRELQNEVSALSDCLTDFQTSLEEHSFPVGKLDTSTALAKTIQACTDLLESLKKKLTKCKILIWPFCEKDTAKSAERLRGCTQIIHFSLSIHGFSVLLKSSQEAVAELKAMRSRQSGMEEKITGVLDSLEIVNRLSANIEDIAKGVSRTETLLQDQTYESFLRWLYPGDSSQKHNSIVSWRLEGSCEWFFESESFHDWIQGKESTTLYCYGDPGVGKTYLTSLVIQHLEESVQTSPPLLLAYFYFSFSDMTAQEPRNLWRCLIRQILSNFDRAPSAAGDLYKVFAKRQPVPSYHSLSSAFIQLCSQNPNVVIIMDALDECDAKLHRRRILKFLKDLMAANVRLFVTSRPHLEEIGNLFAASPNVPIKANESDLRLYLIEKIDERREESEEMWNMISDEYGEEIINALVAKANGMFIYVALQIENILGQPSHRAMGEAVNSLADDLDGSYRTTMDRVNSNPIKSCAALAYRVFLWVYHAKRPLRVGELRHALATTSSPAYLDVESLVPARFLLSYCCGLVVISGQQVIQFVHQSAQEYFHEHTVELIPNGHKTLALTCIAYLSLDDFESGNIDDYEALKTRSTQFLLLDYAATHWGDHAADDIDDEVLGAVEGFYARTGNLQAWAAYDLRLNSQWTSTPRDLSRLHVAARFGLTSWATMDAPQLTADLHRSTTVGDTPLMIASQFGHEAFVRLLLAQPGIWLSLNAADNNGFTAICRAVMANKTATLSTLLERPDVDVNAGSPLFVALKNQSLDAFDTLVLTRQDLDVNSPNDEGHTPLFGAAREIFGGAVRTLLTRDDLRPECGTGSLADLVILFVEDQDIMTDEEIQTVPIIGLDIASFFWKCKMRAAASELDGQEGSNVSLIWFLGGVCCSSFVQSQPHIIEEWIDAGQLDPKMCDEFGRTLFYVAVCESSIELARKLIDHGVLPRQNDPRYWPLYHAASESNEDLVQLLLDHGADATWRDNYGDTALHAAARSGKAANVRILLDHGADACAVNEAGQTVMHWAAYGGNTETVKMLLDHGAEANPKYEPGGVPPPLNIAVSKPEAHLEVVRLLANHGADFRHVGSGDFTMLHLAASNCRADICRFLLEAGVDPNARSADMQTPLNLAMAGMNPDTIEVLVEYGADPTVRDLYGLRPLDWAASWLPAWEKMRQMQYTPTSIDLRKRHLKNSLLFLVQKAIDGRRERMGLKSILRIFNTMGRVLLFLNDNGDMDMDTAAQIAFEQLSEKEGGYQVHHGSIVCSNCRLGSSEWIYEHRYICRTCAGVDLCTKCFKGRDERGEMATPPWCEKHEFLVVPRECWSDLPEGMVDVSSESHGLSLDEWLGCLREHFASEDSVIAK